MPTQSSNHGKATIWLKINSRSSIEVLNFEEKEAKFMEDGQTKWYLHFVEGKNKLFAKIRFEAKERVKQK